MRRLLILAAVLILGGCNDTPPARGSAQDHAAAASGRAETTTRAADASVVDAADKTARADEMERQAKEQPTEARIRAAAEARIEAAAATAVATAMRQVSDLAAVDAQAASNLAADERRVEQDAQAYRAWLRLCRLVGLGAVVAGCVLAGVVGYLTRSPRLAALVGVTLAGTGCVVVAFGPASSWMPWLVVPGGACAMAAWAWAHRGEIRRGTTYRSAAIAGSRTVDAIERDVRAKADEAKAELARALTTAGMADDIERLRGPARDWSRAT